MQRNIPHKENASAEVAFCARDKTRALPTDLIDITTMTCRYCRGRGRGSSDSVGSRGGGGNGGGRGDGTRVVGSAVVVAAITVAQQNNELKFRPKVI
jgi:hypothetical protein